MFYVSIFQALTDQKTRLLTNTAKLSDSNERLREGRKVLAETEELGVSILSDLHQQRQTLLHARESVSLFILFFLK